MMTDSELYSESVGGAYEIYIQSHGSAAEKI